MSEQDREAGPAAGELDTTFAGILAALGATGMTMSISLNFFPASNGEEEDQDLAPGPEEAPAAAVDLSEFQPGTLLLSVDGTQRAVVTENHDGAVSGFLTLGPINVQDPGAWTIVGRTGSGPNNWSSLGGEGRPSDMAFRTALPASALAKYPLDARVGLEIAVPGSGDGVPSRMVVDGHVRALTHYTDREPAYVIALTAGAKSLTGLTHDVVRDEGEIWGIAGG